MADQQYPDLLPLPSPAPIAALGLSAFATALFCLYLSALPGAIATLWLPNALLAAVLARDPPQRWPLWCATVALATLAANLSFGNGWLMSLALVLPNLIEPLAVAAWLRHRQPEGFGFTRPADAMAVLVAAVLLGPLSGMVPAVMLLYWLRDLPPEATAVSWYAGASVGMLAMLPLALSVSLAQSRLLLAHGRRVLEFTAWMLLVLLVPWLLQGVSTPFVFIGAPLLLAAMRLPLAQSLLLNLAATLAVVGLAAADVFPLRPLLPDSPSVLGYLPLALTIAPAFILAALTHIAEARHRALALSESRFRGAMAHSVIGFALIGLDGRCLEVNQALCRMLNYRENELLGRLWHDLIHDEDRGQLQDEALLQGRLPSYQLELRYRCRDGQTAWGLLAVSLASDAEGRPAYFVAQLKNIEQRKQAEQRLADSEALFRAVAETAHDGLISVDSRRQIIYSNAAAERLFGYSNKALQGFSIDRLLPDCPAPDPDRPEHAPVTSRALEGLRRDGNRFTVEVSLAGWRLGEQRFFTAIVRDVSERQRSAQRLVESEARFRAVAETANDAFISADQSGRIIYFNAAAERIFGYSADELMHQSIERLIPERYRYIHEFSMQRAVIAGEDGEAGPMLGGRARELEGRRRDGSEFPLEISLAAWKLGGQQYFTAVIRDVSERKAAERRAAADEARWKFALENDAQAVYDWNLVEDTIFRSETWYRLLGVRQGEETSGAWNARIHPDDAPAVRLALETHLHGASDLFSCEYRFRHNDGRYLWLHDRGRVIERDPAGRALRMIGIERDVSAEKNADQERQHLLERITVATRAVGIGIWEWDLTDNSVIWDARMVELYGVAGSLNREGWRAALHPRDRERIDAEISLALSGWAPFDATFRIVRPDGEVRVMRGAAQILRNERGAAVRMVGSNWDISDSVRAERELKEINQRLERSYQEIATANEEVRNFAYIVSHDLRAPLVNVQGFAGELRYAIATLESQFADHDDSLPAALRERCRQLAEDMRESLDFINTAVTRMDRQISAVLRLSRMGRQQLQFEPVELEPLVASILASLHHDIELARGSTSLAPLPAVTADRNALEQILGNLLSNAVKYREPGRPLRIALWASRGSQGVSLHIMDNGRGIAKEDIPRAFELFRRVGVQDTAGEGMGLAYVQALVKRHQGRIWCDSQLGEGSVFHVFLPPTPSQAPWSATP